MLDGATGTALQAANLSAADFGGPERPPGGRGQALEHVLLALGVVTVDALRALLGRDFEYDLAPSLNGCENLPIELVNFAAEGA